MTLKAHINSLELILAAANTKLDTAIKSFEILQAVNQNAQSYERQVIDKTLERLRP